MYFRARYYDPSTGEFISRDPLGYVDGMSQYRAYFVPGAMDPFGLEVRQITTAERAEISKVPGGKELLKRYDDLVKANNDQAEDFLAELNSLADAIARGDTNVSTGQPLTATTGKKTEKIEPDVLTAKEIIERKNGDFSKKKRLSGPNKTQLEKLCRFVKGTKKFTDAKGNVVVPPKKIVYEFDTDCKVNDDLKKWIKSRCLDKDGNSLIEIRITGGK